MFSEGDLSFLYHHDRFFFAFKNLLTSVTELEPCMFHDMTSPVLVICCLLSFGLLQSLGNVVSYAMMRKLSLVKLVSKGANGGLVSSKK